MSDPTNRQHTYWCPPPPYSLWESRKDPTSKLDSHSLVFSSILLPRHSWRPTLTDAPHHCMGHIQLTAQTYWCLPLLYGPDTTDRQPTLTDILLYCMSQTQQTAYTYCWPPLFYGTETTDRQPTLTDILLYCVACECELSLRLLKPHQGE